MGWEVARDVVGVIAPLATVALAAYGVSTWRRQLRGNAEHEVARGLLRTGLRLRDAIHAARNLLMTSAEMFAALKKEGVSEEKIAEVIAERGFEAGMRQRLEVALEQASLFEDQLVEAEVLWGRPLVTRLVDLRNRVVELAVNLNGYFRTKREVREYQDRLERFGGEYDETIRKMRERHFEHEAIAMGVVADTFGAAVEAAARELDRTVRPHLGAAWRGRRRSSALRRIRVAWRRRRCLARRSPRGPH
jgi:hypothetical protein